MRLLPETVGTFGKGDASIGAQHPVPRKVRIGIAAEDPGRQARAAGEPCPPCDFTVAGDLSARNRTDRGKQAPDGIVAGHQAQPNNSNRRNMPYAMPPAAGMVKIQAQMIRSITVIFSARGFLAKPTPMIAVEML